MTKEAVGMYPGGSRQKYRMNMAPLLGIMNVEWTKRYHTVSTWA